MQYRKALATGDYKVVTPSGLRISISVSNKISWRKKYDRDIVFIGHEDESIMEHLFNRHNRPLAFYHKEILPTVTKLTGLPENTRYRWAQKAGCSCPCSPGFMPNSKSYSGRDIDVTVGVEVPKNEVNDA